MSERLGLSLDASSIASSIEEGFEDFEKATLKMLSNSWLD
jgi:hypothetical protein